ncbi:hypothetical protein PAXRUDRAFT_170875 [Paxillus rubicundulus Ve08.2h10]|uniref:Uncharacterized protein n=1 Tax=Paxillus rubicundulus Ve08.2h10 TaxID=930991 RepID=A0A0D0D7A0_9AGAM|nr:hypothetical protein PAXRUDRAFT_170875 [Paxillus rubicundulus Ve08.2h10]
MSSNTASADTPTRLTLIGPSNFQILKLWITVKLWREEILGVALGIDILPLPLPVPATSPSIHGPSTISPTLSGTPTISNTATAGEVRKWTEWNEGAHKIIQDSIIFGITS